MKKWMESRWKRFLTIFLTAVMFTVSIGGFCGVILAEYAGAYDTKHSVLYSRGERNLQSIYSKKIYDNINTNPECMEGSRMEYAIVRGFDLTDAELADKSRCIYHTDNFYQGNPEKKKLVAENFYPDVWCEYCVNLLQSLYSNGGSYSKWSYLDEIHIRKSQAAEKDQNGDSGKNLSVLYDSWQDLYTGNDGLGGFEDLSIDFRGTVTEKIRRLVYNQDDGVFYYESDNLAYPMEKIQIRCGGLLAAGNIEKLPKGNSASRLITFTLRERDGKQIYLSDNGTSLVLDTTKYRLWGDIAGDYTQITADAIATISSSAMLPRILHKTSNTKWMEWPKKNSGQNKRLPRFQYTYQDVKTVEQYWIVSYVMPQALAGDTDVNDLFSEQRVFIGFLCNMRYVFIALAILPLLIGFASAVLFCILQHARGKEYAAQQCKEEKTGFWRGRVSLLAHLVWISAAVACLIEFGVVIPLDEIFQSTHSVNIQILLAGLGLFCIFVSVYMVIWFLAKAAFQQGAKRKRLILERLRGWRDTIRGNFSLLAKTVILLAVLTILELWVIGVTAYSMEAELFFFCIYKVAEVLFVLTVVLQLKKLQEEAKKLADGDLNCRMDTSKLLWEFKKHGDYLNQISAGMLKAVDERMKSEHFKTELLTNVSHDIKTPLTSIINYVDLMKKETITEKRVLEYLEVLDRQSARMKKLIEDLMEASKASTGNLSVNLVICDIHILITQMTGEYKERFEQAQLEVVVSQPEQPLYILADDRHLWRIFDNLMKNIYKYSQPGSRVYIDAGIRDRKVQIVFRNMSKYPLNISSEELLERFVRGDSSRNTEGSGLGLSIAQNLAELMGGKLELYIDGDLFKVIVSFPENIQK